MAHACWQNVFCCWMLSSQPDWARNADLTQRCITAKYCKSCTYLGWLWSPPAHVIQCLMGNSKPPQAHLTDTLQCGQATSHQHHWHISSGVWWLLKVSFINEQRALVQVGRSVPLLFSLVSLAASLHWMMKFSVWFIKSPACPSGKLTFESAHSFSDFDKTRGNDASHRCVFFRIALISPKGSWAITGQNKWAYF